MQSLSSRVFKASSVIILFTLLSAPLGYLLRILFARTLSIELFGLLYAVIAFFLLITQYTDLGFGYALTYFIPKFIKNNETTNIWNSYIYCLIISFFFSSFLGIILFFTANWFSLYYFKHPASQNLIYIFLLFTIINSLLNSTYYLFVALQKEIYYSSKETIRLLISVVCALFFYISNQGSIITYSLSWIMGYLGVVIFYVFLILTKESKIITSFTIEKKLLKKLSIYAIPTIFTSIITSFIAMTDIALLTYFKGVREVGIYNVFFPIAMIPSMFLIPLNSFLLPFTSHVDTLDKEKIEKLISKIFVYIPLIVWYFSLFIILFPESTVTILFGSKWALVSKWPLMLLSVSIIFFSLANYLTVLALGLGLVRNRMQIGLSVAAINLLFNIFFISQWGVMGVVISNGLIYIMSTILYTILLKKKIAFKIPVSGYIEILLMSIILILTTQLLRINPTGLFQFLLFGFLYTILIITYGISAKLIKIPHLRWLIKK